MSTPTSPAENSTQKAYYASYADFSKILRTWFVAYGIGGPIVLLSNNVAWGWLVKSGKIFTVGLLFLIGGALQVSGALLNKHAMWCLYVGESDVKRQSMRNYRFWYKYSELGSVDVLLDLATIILLGCATWLAFSTIMAAPPEVFLAPKS
jgi:hypothetical protein